MSRQQSKELQAGWKEETTASSLDALLRGRPVSPHGTPEGRVDLRGLMVEKPERVRISDQLSRITKLYEFNRQSIRDVDFSSSVLHEWRVVNSTFKNCIFDNAKMPGYRGYSAVFDTCSFRSSMLRDATMGAKEKGSKTACAYRGCDFSAADLRNVSTEYGRFSGCIFAGSRWYITQTLSAVFEDCDFRDAEIKEVRFDGRRFDSNGLAGLSENKMAGCDFSTARLDGSSFLAIDFRNLTPPLGDRYVLIASYPSRVAIAMDRLRANGSREAAGLAFVFEAEFKAATAMPQDSVGMLDFGILSETQANLLAVVFEIA